jgi:phosphohistidine swiveling domain-containing protein
MDLSKLYQTQISLTEWFQRMGLENSEAHRKEDNEKRERLAVLNEYFGLPFDRPTQFPASEVANRTERFMKFVDERGDELCALRLIPHDPSLPKLRTRGASIRDSLKWFAEQNVNPELYKADFVPHPSDNTWSTIFVVNQHGAFGQVLAGPHNQLTQGFYTEGMEPITFSWNGERWDLNPNRPAAETHLREVLEMLRVSDPAVREKITETFGAKFFGEYLCGYFETATSTEFGIWFIDWNRILGDVYGEDMPVGRSFGEPQDDGGKNSDSVILSDGEGSPVRPLSGQIGSRGLVTGRARVIPAADLVGADIEPGDILVTDMTTPDFLPLMMKSGGVVTAWGGILCHAAIVCRELGKPCLTNVNGLLESVHNGTMITVDADSGILSLCSTTEK